MGLFYAYKINMMADIATKIVPEMTIMYMKPCLPWASE
jgi:hypothetical protein